MPSVSRTRRDLLVFFAYLALALILTYPLVRQFTMHVAGDGSDDPALAWNLWWVPHALLDLGRSPIYTDYLFFPIGLNLAYYTLTYLNAFLSIPIQFTFGLIPAANVNLLLSFTLSGFGAYLLVEYLLRQDFSTSPLAPRPSPLALASFAAGLLYAFSSNKLLYASLGQFNIASSQWIPFYILYLLKVLPTATQARPPTRRDGFLLGLFLLFQALSELIFASFLILFTLAYAIYWLWVKYYELSHDGTWDVPRIRNCELGIAKEGSRNSQFAIRSLFVSILTFVLPMSPILAAMLSDLLTEGDYIQQGLGFSNSFSADLLGFLIPSHLHPLLGGLEAQFQFSYINFVYLGYVALALAVVALWRVPRARIWGFWFAIIFLITLGPTLRVNGHEFSLPFLPFNALLEIPIVKGNRYPSRWSVLLTLCLAVMVGYGIAWILQRLEGSRLVRSRREHTNLLTWNLLTVSLIGALLLFEHLSVPLPTFDLTIPAIYQQIGREPGNFTVMELPLAWRNGFRVTGSYRAGSQAPIDPIFMLAQWYQTAQQHPILNGNTSRNPELKFQYFSETPVLDSIIAIQEGYSLDDATLARDKQLAPRVLQFLNVRYVVWHAPALDTNRDVAAKTRAYIETIFPLTKISETYENDRGLVVYRVNALPENDSLTLTPGDPLARPYFGEGWGVVGSGSFVAERGQAKLLVPLAAPRDRTLTLHQLITPDAQTVSLTANETTGIRSISNSAGDYTFTIPAAALHQGVNELTLTFGRTVPYSSVSDRLLPYTHAPPNSHTPIPPHLSASIVVRSAGEEQGAFGHIYVNGVDESPNLRGYNVVVIDPESGKVEGRANFDTCACDAGIADPEGNSNALALFIAGIPNGKIVAVAASDEASLHLTGDAVAAFKTIGAQQDLRGKFRWSHAIIGVKGANSGSALEVASEKSVSQLVVGLGMTEPNIAATIGSISIAPTP